MHRALFPVGDWSENDLLSWVAAWEAASGFPVTITAQDEVADGYLVVGGGAEELEVALAHCERDLPVYWLGEDEPVVAVFPSPDHARVFLAECSGDGGPSDAADWLCQRVGGQFVWLPYAS